MAKNVIYRRSITAENPVTPEEQRSGESILARLVAAAYAADHPEACGRIRHEILAEELTPQHRGRTLQAGGTTSCSKQLMAPDHAA